MTAAHPLRGPAIALALAMSALPSFATVLTSGSISPSTLTTNPTTTSQIIVGVAATGGLEVNASPSGNGFTVVTSNTGNSTGVVVGFSTNGLGTVNVIGNGAASSALLTTPKAISVGSSGGAGTLAISAGGRVETTGETAFAGSAVQAGNSSSSGEITVDGANSALHATGRVQIGAFSNSSGTLVVSNGAAVLATGTIDTLLEIGSGDDATGGVVVTGGSTVDTTGLIIGSSEVGSANPNTGTLDVEDAATVSVDTFPSGTGGGVFVGSAAGSQITVTGAGSGLWIAPITSGFNAGKEVIVGGFGDGALLVEDQAEVQATGANFFVGGGFSGSLTDPGTLTVRGGASLYADTVTVRQNGRLDGDGDVNANVVVDGGTIDAGNSPGTLTVGGNLVVDGGGVLTIEIDGPGAGQADVYDVAGGLTLGPDAVIRLVFGYSPSGETLDLEGSLLAGALIVDPGFDLASALDVQGLQPGDSATVQLDGDQVVLPEPGRLALFVSGLAALALLDLRRRSGERRAVPGR